MVKRPGLPSQQLCGFVHRLYLGLSRAPPVFRDQSHSLFLRSGTQEHVAPSTNDIWSE